MIGAFAQASGKQIPYRIIGRRPGDIARCFADPTLAKTELGWTARFGIQKMCEDTWHWQVTNPQGYK
jgi:UDP-glucose 4-epimerase